MALAWLLLCAFIVHGSLGTWTPDGRAIWAPLLVVPRDVIRNVLLYVPFGALGVAVLHHGMKGALRVTALAVLFSLANEMLQLYTIDRVASLIDVASAAIGALGGAMAVSASRRPR